jgi:hypothetical protein
MYGAHIAPCLIFFEAIETVTGRDATFTARTSIQIDFEGILLSGCRSREWDKLLIKPSLVWLSRNT